VVRDRPLEPVNAGANGAGSVPDWECFDLALGGDEEAWRTLYRRHERRLARMATVITGSADAAGDVAQETFVRLLQRKVTHRDGTLGAYLTTIAFRLALREKSRTARQGEFDESELPGAHHSPLEAASRADRKGMVAGVLESLPDDQRQIIALRFFGGHSYDEIACILGVPAGTVKSRIFYAVKNCRGKLRREIGNDYDEGRGAV
jgi:RNA polymerase sigma factor (sigma-70 family)